MNYFFAASVLAMMGYMIGVTWLRMRRDRVFAQRELTRGRYAFRRPKERVRFLLSRAFHPPAETAPWEETLVSKLARTPADSVSGKR
jgi:hypothetical protein